MEALVRPQAATPIRSLAPWLGVLLAGLFLLSTLGGWVRLSGAGVAIPHWPVIELEDGRWTVLPPLTAEGWAGAERGWQQHQDKLEERVARGELVAANLGRLPASHREFQAMFLTEWSHRLFAAAIGLLAAACLVTALRDRSLRGPVGVPLTIAAVLIVFQAVIGGLLVEDGTGTRWLFIHQANAAGIIASVLWAVLTILRPAGAATQAAPRTGWWIAAAMAAAFTSLLSGALVASSRHGAPALPFFGDRALHLTLHLGAVVALVVALGVAMLTAGRVLGERGRLALQVAATFVGVQMLLGMATYLAGTAPTVALAHQFMGMCVFAALVLAVFDWRHEEPLGAP